MCWTFTQVPKQRVFLNVCFSHGIQIAWLGVKDFSQLPKEQREISWASGSSGIFCRPEHLLGLCPKWDRTGPSAPCEAEPENELIALE